MFQEIPRNCRYAYARVSSKSQEENSSLDAQKQEFIQQGVPKKLFTLIIFCNCNPRKINKATLSYFI